MERSYDNPPLNSTQIMYPVRNEADKRTNLSPSQRMPLIRLPAGSPLFSPGPRSPMFHQSPILSPFSSLIPSSSSLFHGYSSAPVENKDSSIGFNNNSSLPPMMSPSTGFNNNPFLPPVSPSVEFKKNSSKPPMSPFVGFKNYSPRAPMSPSVRFNNNHSRPPMSSSVGVNSNNSRPPTSPSTGLKKNSSLPPMIPSVRSNLVRVSDNTLRPRKAHKWSKSDIIGLNSMIPLNSSELNDPKPLESLIGESSRGKKGVGEMKSDEEFKKKFNSSAFINSEFNAFNFNENNDEIFTSINILEDENRAIGSGSKIGSTSSGVKRRAGQESEILSKRYRSGSLDSCFNELVKKPHLPHVNLNCKVSSTNSVHENDITGSDSKRAKRMLANRQAVARYKAKKDRRTTDLEYSVMTMNTKINILSGQLAFYEKKTTALMTENEELKIRIESMKQHAKLGDAMNKQLNGETKWLKAAISLNQQLSAQVQRLNVATTVDEQLSAEVQQLNLITGEVMQNPTDFERSNMPPMNENILQQVNFNQYSQP